MKRFCLFLYLGFLCIAFMLYAGGCGGSGGSETSSESGSSGGNRYIVRMKKDRNPADVAVNLKGVLEKTFRVGEMEYGVITLPSAPVSDELSGNALIDYAEPVCTWQAHALPDDPYYSPQQYCHRIMDSEKAWDITQGSDSITVAVVDTGVDGTHPEFSGRMVAGYDFIEGKALTGNENSDGKGHGTHVAGIIAGTGNNGIGIAGLNWNCRIMPVRVLNNEGFGEYDGILQGVIFAVDNGADVINMSLGGSGYSQAFADAIQWANSRGVVVVVSMGNDGTTVLKYPAGYQGVIAVGCTNAENRVAVFSTRGRNISVSAPGEVILSTIPGGNYEYMSGTSMASPQVAGLVSLLLSANPGWTPEQIRSQIEATATDIDATGYDTASGYGVINAESALTSENENKYGSVQVSVTAGGSVVSGVDVVLYDMEGNTVSTTRSDYEGRAVFYFVPGGQSFSVSGNYLNAVDTSETFNVTAGNMSDVSLQF